MSRHIAAVAVALCLAPSWLWAQSPEFTVSVESAAVRKSPSTASPVIGKAPRGTVLVVTRDIGAWVKVSWPDAEDGAGYVHQSMGSFTRRTTLDQRLAPAFAGSTTAPATQGSVVGVSTPADTVPETARTVYVAPPTHFVGLGGSLGVSTPSGFGVTARIWSRNQLGVQVDVSRSTMTPTTASDRMTSVQFMPSVVYSFRDRVNDNIWVRPYIGGGVPFTRSTLKADTPDAVASLPEKTYGVRAFGGGEVTFPSVPRFAVSLDLGYLWTDTAFPGYETKGLGFAVLGHWYVK